MKRIAMVFCMVLAVLLLVPSANASNGAPDTTQHRGGLTLTLNPRPVGGTAIGYNFDTDVKWGRVWAGTPVVSLNQTITMYSYLTWSGSLTEPPKSGLGADVVFVGSLRIPHMYGLVGAGRMANAVPDGDDYKAGFRYLMGGAYALGETMTLIVMYELIDRGEFGFDDNLYFGIGIDNLWESK